MSITIEANRESIVNAVREWSPVERAALIRDVAETLVAQPEIAAQESDPFLYTSDELEAIYRLHPEWREHHRRLVLEWQEQCNHRNPFEEMSQEEAIEYMRAEWEANKLVRAIYLDNEPLPPTRDTLAEIYGLANADHPGPSDEEVEQWLHEHKMEKYG